jgi:hypothetical protein
MYASVSSPADSPMSCSTSVMDSRMLPSHDRMMSSTCVAASGGAVSYT